MPVTDEQIAALRAYLEGDVEHHDALHERVDPAGYAELLVAAFFEAADRRFGRNGTKADVVEFVVGLRSRTGRLADAIDPRARLGLAARELDKPLSDARALADHPIRTPAGGRFHG